VSFRPTSGCGVGGGGGCHSARRGGGGPEATNGIGGGPPGGGAGGGQRPYWTISRLWRGRPTAHALAGCREACREPALPNAEAREPPLLASPRPRLGNPAAAAAAIFFVRRRGRRTGRWGTLGGRPTRPAPVSIWRRTATGGLRCCKTGQGYRVLKTSANEVVQTRQPAKRTRREPGNLQH